MSYTLAKEIKIQLSAKINLKTKEKQKVIGNLKNLHFVCCGSKGSFFIEENLRIYWKIIEIDKTTDEDEGFKFDENKTKIVVSDKIFDYKNNNQNLTKDKKESSNSGGSKDVKESSIQDKEEWDRIFSSEPVKKENKITKHKIIKLNKVPKKLKEKKIKDISYTYLRDMRKEIQSVLNQFDRDIYIGVISYHPNSGKGSFINTIYRSFYEEYSSNISYTQPIKSTKSIIYSFHKRGVNNNVYFVEFPVIGDIETSEFDFKNIDVIVCLTPANLFEFEKDKIKDWSHITENIFKKKSDSQVISGFTKLDLVNGKDVEYIEHIEFKMANYVSQFQRLGDDYIDYRALKAFEKIVKKIYNRSQNLKSHVTIGSYFEMNQIMEKDDQKIQPKESKKLETKPVPKSDNGHLIYIFIVLIMFYVIYWRY